MSPKQIALNIREQALGYEWPMFCYLKKDALEYARAFTVAEDFTEVTEEEKRMFLLFIAESLS